MTEAYSSKQLDAAFDMVKNFDHWKGPIDAIVSPEKVAIVREAINYFAYGMVETETLDSGLVRVTAPGYWAVEEMTADDIMNVEGFDGAVIKI